MNKFVRRAVMLGIAFATPVGAASAQVLDQYSHTIGGTADIISPAIGQSYGFAQTFTPGLNNIVRAGAYLGLLQSGTSSGLMTATVTDLMGNPVGPTAVAPYSLTGSAGTAAWFYADFSAPIGLSNPQYALYYSLVAIDPRSDADVVNYYTESDYAGGDWYTFYAGPPPTSPEGPWTPYDIAFEEYGVEGFSPTPEPGSIVLLATGLVGLVGITRRRRSNA